MPNLNNFSGLLGTGAAPSCLASDPNVFRAGGIVAQHGKQLGKEGLDLLVYTLMDESVLKGELSQPLLRIS